MIVAMTLFCNVRRYTSHYTLTKMHYLERPDVGGLRCRKLERIVQCYKMLDTFLVNASMAQTNNSIINTSSLLNSSSTTPINKSSFAHHSSMVLVHTKNHNLVGTPKIRQDCTEARLHSSLLCPKACHVDAHTELLG